MPRLPVTTNQTTMAKYKTTMMPTAGIVNHNNTSLATRIQTTTTATIQARLIPWAIIPDVKTLALNHVPGRLLNLIANHNGMTAITPASKPKTMATYSVGNLILPDQEQTCCCCTTQQTGNDISRIMLNNLPIVTNQYYCRNKQHCHSWHHAMHTPTLLSAQNLHAFLTLRLCLSPPTRICFYIITQPQDICTLGRHIDWLCRKLWIVQALKSPYEITIRSCLH